LRLTGVRVLWFNPDVKKAFETVALIGKYNSPEIAEPVLQLGRFFDQRGVAVMLDALSASHVGSWPHTVSPLEQMAKEADLAIVIGGDGTTLNIARILAPFDVPLVGVNQGRLGFLTDISIDTMFETLGAILEGRFISEERMLLTGDVVTRGERVSNVLAFNEVVVSKGVKGSMIEFEVRIDGQFIYSQRSDGLIVATPTGSTAYALSSGGPIVHPALKVMTLVPVCPHTLSNRPIVIDGGCTVEIVMHNAEDPRAHFDNHSHFEMREGDRVVVRRYPRSIRLLHPADHSYYAMLREKLNWHRA
jgi:NAD+ kinase